MIKKVTLPTGIPPKIIMTPSCKIPTPMSWLTLRNGSFGDGNYDLSVLIHWGLSNKEHNNKSKLYFMYICVHAFHKWKRLSIDAPSHIVPSMQFSFPITITPQPSPHPTNTIWTVAKFFRQRYMKCICNECSKVCQARILARRARRGRGYSLWLCCVDL